jgi:hypothetical protein
MDYSILVAIILTAVSKHYFDNNAMAFIAWNLFKIVQSNPERIAWTE